MEKFDFGSFMATVRRAAGESRRPEPIWRELRYIMAFNGEEFVRQAYRSILEREPDPSGLAAYMPLALSTRGKIRAIHALLLSPERGSTPHWLRCAGRKAEKSWFFLKKAWRAALFPARIVKRTIKKQLAREK